MVEAHVAASTIGLLPALAFSGSTVAPYVLGKSQISVHSSGATLYGAGSAGSRVARFAISASAGAMLDLSSLTISAKVHNLEAAQEGGATTNQVQFLSPSLSGLIESARITIGGVEVSSCDYVGRTEHLMGIMQSDDVRRSDYASGFGLATDSQKHGKYTTKPILGGKTRDVVWQPRCLGILAMPSYLPVSMVPGAQMTLEITWVSDPQICCNSTAGTHKFNWNVSNLVVNVDVISVESSFLSSLSSHMFAGNSLQMQYQNYHTSYHTLLASAIQLTHSRAASRLNTVLVTLATTDTATQKAANTLYIPSSQDLKARITIGEKRFPATEDTQGLSLFYRRLMHSMQSRPPNISREQFETDSFIAAFDLESAPNIQHSGVSTNNAPLSLFMEGIHTGAPGAAGSDNTTPTAVFLHIAYDTLLEVTARGVVVGV